MRAYPTCEIIDTMKERYDFRKRLILGTVDYHLHGTRGTCRGKLDSALRWRMQYYRSDHTLRPQTFYFLPALLLPLPRWEIAPLLSLVYWQHKTCRSREALDTGLSCPQSGEKIRLRNMAETAVTVGLWAACMYGKTHMTNVEQIDSKKLLMLRKIAKRGLHFGIVVRD